MANTFYILSYDIRDPKRLRKIAKIMTGYGTRVQKSVFEALLTQDLLQKVIQKCQGIINSEQDTIRIYNLCMECREKVQILGNGKVLEEIEFVII